LGFDIPSPALRRELRAQSVGCNPTKEGASPSRDSNSWVLYWGWLRPSGNTLLGKRAGVGVSNPGGWRYGEVRFLAPGTELSSP